MSTYEPGTVAVATVRGVEGVRVIKSHHKDQREYRWWTADTRVHRGDLPWLTGRDVTDVRPLVVLNLDNPSEFIRVLRDGAYNEADVSCYDALAYQIEAQTKPAKPNEPKGLGAVVKDSSNRLWVRRTSAVGEFPWALGAIHSADGLGWSQIDAVEVLSEGVVA